MIYSNITTICAYNTGYLSGWNDRSETAQEPPQSDNKTPPERTKQEHFFMKHRKHLGTRRFQSEENNPQQFHTRQDQYDKPLYTVVEPHRQGYIHKAYFASQKLIHLNYLNAEWATYYLKNTLMTDGWEWAWQKDRTPDTVIFCQES